METNFIRQYRNTISSKECEKIIRFFEDTVSAGFTFVGDGSEENGGSGNRVDTSILLDKASMEITKKINEIVINCWSAYVTDLPFLKDYPVASYTLKMQKTPEMGGFHMWHFEHGGQNVYRNRMAVWTLYLTDHEDEGETEFLAHGLKVKPEAGKFCIFPADYTAVHRGNPVYSKPKYIITGWYEYNY